MPWKPRGKRASRKPAESEAKSRSKRMKINQNHSRMWMAILNWLRLPISISTDRTRIYLVGRKGWGMDTWRKTDFVIILVVCSPRPIKEKLLNDLFPLKGSTHQTVEQARFSPLEWGRVEQKRVPVLPHWSAWGDKKFQ